MNCVYFHISVVLQFTLAVASIAPLMQYCVFIVTLHLMVSNNIFLTVYEPRELETQNISSLVTTAVKHQTYTKTKEETHLLKPWHITLEKQPADRLTLSRGHFLKVCLRDFSKAPFPPPPPRPAGNPRGWRSVGVRIRPSALY